MPSPKRSFVHESSREVDSDEDELTTFVNDLWDSPINKTMIITLRNVETPFRNDIISHRREELKQRITDTSATSSELLFPIDPCLQTSSDSPSSRSRPSQHLLQTSTPEEDSSHPHEPRESPVFDLSEDDGMVSIKEGNFLHTQNSGNSKQPGGRKRQRWNIQDAPESKRGKWSILFESVRLDFVQKGPDNPSLVEHDGKGRRRTADDEETRLMITKRYEEIFGKDENPMTKLQMDAVLSPLAF